MSIFEYDEEKEMALFRAAEREEGYELGLEQGLEQGLQSLICTLQKLSLNTNTIYEKVIENPHYASLTRDAFEKYLKFGSDTL